MEDNKITLTATDGSEETFFIVETTRFQGKDYILVADSDDEEGEANAYILKDTSEEENPEAVYEFVEDENELDAVWKIFGELLDEDTELI